MKCRVAKNLNWNDNDTLMMKSRLVESFRTPQSSSLSPRSLCAFQHTVTPPHSVALCMENVFLTQFATLTLRKYEWMCALLLAHGGNSWTLLALQNLNKKNSWGDGREIKSSQLHANFLASNKVLFRLIFPASSPKATHPYFTRDSHTIHFYVSYKKKPTEWVNYEAKCCSEMCIALDWDSFHLHQRVLRKWTHM